MGDSTALPADARHMVATARADVARPYASRFLRIEPERGIFQVSRRVFTDDAVFREEWDKILLKSWTLLGMGSEIPRPNDFLLRQVLDRQIIFSRDREGAVHALVNACSHRGALVCREKSGTRKTFTCPYHGWVYRNSGELLHTGDGYPQGFNGDHRYDLRRAPRLESYRDFHFIAFEPDVPPLSEYLGEARTFLDNFALQSERGLAAISGCFDYAVRCNYKLYVENHIDGFHVEVTHSSFLRYYMDALLGNAERDIGGLQQTAANGHTMAFNSLNIGRTVARPLPGWSADLCAAVAEKRKELERRLDPERARFIADNAQALVVFPNTVFVDNSSLTMRFVIPVSHNRTILRTWMLGPADEEPLLRQARIKYGLGFLGPAGMGTQDDIEVMEIAQTGYEMTRDEWNDVSRYFDPGTDPMSGQAPQDGELGLRNYWLQYDALMGGDRCR